VIENTALSSIVLKHQLDVVHAIFMVCVNAVKVRIKIDKTGLGEKSPFLIHFICIAAIIPLEINSRT
jgi:hypothetical protein